MILIETSAEGIEHKGDKIRAIVLKRDEITCASQTLGLCTLNCSLEGLTACGSRQDADCMYVVY